MSEITDTAIPSKYTEDSVPDSLVRRMVHKLRNPLSVVITAASQLELREGGAASADDVEFVDTICTAADTIEAILARFSRFACPEPNEFEDVDINAICQAELDQVINGWLEDKRPRSNLKFADDIPTISTDPMKLRLALSELISNAMIMLPTNGLVTLHTNIAGDDVKITIEDDGPGIARENIAHMCEPFVTTRPGGVGLGLAIARALVAQIGGKLSVEAREERGLRALILLPLYSVNRE